jgi:hypothetical protein
MEEIVSPPAHSCAHCADIVFPGSPEEIYVADLGPPEDPFGNLFFREQPRNGLGLSLTDLRLKANAGCDFAKYLKDDLEYGVHEKYRDANPDAIQLYTHQIYGGPMDFEALICLQSLHLQDDVFKGRDVSRCFVTAGSAGGSLYICCILSDTSGKSLAY